MPARPAALLLLAALAAGCRSAPPTPAEPRPLTAEQVQARLGRPGVYLFDANPIEMYQRAHLPGARWVQWDGVTASDLPPDREAELVFYCANPL